MRHKVDILNLEWETDSRDTNIVDPVLVSLEDRYGYSVKRDSIWYGFYKLLKYRPKVLLMSNELGAVENTYLCRFAYAVGIRVIVLISEGLNYECDNEEDQRTLENEMLWGHNLEHRTIYDLKLLWSQDTKKSIIKYADRANKLNIKVSGATGFDSYKILDFGKNILREIGKEKYKKVILLVGFAFDLYPLYDLERQHMDKEEVEWLYNQRFTVRDIYKSLIENNPDTLFILKHHPGSMNLNDTEFADIMNVYDNTVTVHKEYNIRSLLAISDVVIAFDSTVCLEGWLLGKPSLIINPKEGNFARSWNYLGSPIIRTEEELQSKLDEYYSTGKINSFDEIEHRRNKMIEKQIQFGDGFNYLRASKLINDELNISRKHEKDDGVFKLAVRRYLREAGEFLIEKQPIPFVKLKARDSYLGRSSRYNKLRREESVKEYRLGIQKLEKNNIEKVSDIIENYKG